MANINTKIVEKLKKEKEQKENKIKCLELEKDKILEKINNLKDNNMKNIDIKDMNEDMLFKILDDKDEKLLYKRLNMINQFIKKVKEEQTVFTDETVAFKQSLVKSFNGKAIKRIQKIENDLDSILKEIIELLAEREETRKELVSIDKLAGNFNSIFSNGLDNNMKLELVKLNKLSRGAEDLNFLVNEYLRQRGIYFAEAKLKSKVDYYIGSK